MSIRHAIRGVRTILLGAPAYNSGATRSSLPSLRAYALHHSIASKHSFQTPFLHAIVTAAAAATAVVTGAISISHADAHAGAHDTSSSTPPSSCKSATPLPEPSRTECTWAHVLHALKHRDNARNAHVRHEVREIGKGTNVYALEFTPVSDTALNATLVALADTLQGKHVVVNSVVDAGRNSLLLDAGDTTILVSTPRFGPFERRVQIAVTKGADHGEEEEEGRKQHLFTERELSAILRARDACENNAGMVTRRSRRDLDRAHTAPGAAHSAIDEGTIGDAANAFNAWHEHGVQERNMYAIEEDARERERNARKKLEQLGIDVVEGNTDLNWNALAGYEEVKRKIEDTLTLPLRHPGVYEAIVRGTRERFESNRPKAVLYEGPPGCGKTLSARILAATVGIPFVHIPLESLLSKFYGETTRRLAAALQAANDLGPCVVFIDECDAIGLSRNSTTQINEVTRRTLSVLLRHIDGIDGPQNSILLAATNCKQDIDPALMSRFDVVISFPLPDTVTRAAVLKLYAKHLCDSEISRLAAMTDGFSGREILDACEEAERAHAGKLVREKEKRNGSLRLDRRTEAQEYTKLPVLQDYVDAVRTKARSAVGRNSQGHGGHTQQEFKDKIEMRSGDGPNRRNRSFAA